jgi:sterol 3beta-glucosyltransferase
MKITLLVSGTRGDVQPFVGLALALRRRGHDVCMAAARGFADMVAYSGVRHVPLSADYETVFQSEEGVRWLNAGNMLKFMRVLADIDRRTRPPTHREMLAACEGADGIIANLPIENSAACIAERLKLPLLLGYTLPMLPTAEFQSPLFAQWKLPLRSLNRPTHSLFEAVFWQTQKELINDWRRELGLPSTSVSMRERIRRVGSPILHAYSSHLVPRPSDWSAANFLTGFWTMPAEDSFHVAGEPSAELVRWLEAGPAPIYLGFWRLPVLDKLAMLQIAIDAADALGVRFALGATWTAEDLGGRELPDNIFMTTSVDHSWLFSRCTATVHHGGAGTTAASLRAKLPMVICSVSADQPFWGKQVAALGVGCSTSFRKLTAPWLTRALRQIQDGAVRERAARLGEALRQEDGIAEAVRVIEERLPRAPLLC